MGSSNAENEKLRQVTRAVVRRLEKAAQFCGDPQHPLWDGGRTSAEARRRIEGLLDILDPFRPELEDASDEDWDRVYKLDPIDAFVSDFEELAQTQRDEALQALAESRARFGDSEARRAELEAVIEKVRGLIHDRTFAETVSRDFAGNWWPQMVAMDDLRNALSESPSAEDQEVERTLEDSSALIGMLMQLKRAAAIRKGDTNV